MSTERVKVSFFTTDKASLGKVGCHSLVLYSPNRLRLLSRHVYIDLAFISAHGMGRWFVLLGSKILKNNWQNAFVHATIPKQSFAMLLVSGVIFLWFWYLLSPISAIQRREKKQNIANDAMQSSGKGTRRRAAPRHHERRIRFTAASSHFFFQPLFQRI